MNVTSTGRPRSDASENGMPFWSASRKPGARTAPAAHAADGASAAGIAPELDESRPRARSRSASATPSASSSSTPQKAQRNRDAATAGGCAATSRRSADGEQVDDEHERLVRLDHPAGSACAVRERGRDRQPAAAAGLHPLDAGVPARDDLALAELELERLPAIPRRVELLAGEEGDADVVHRYLRALGRLVALADDEVVDAELERDVAFRLVDVGLLERHRSSVREALSAAPFDRGLQDDVAHPLERGEVDPLDGGVRSLARGAVDRGRDAR